MRHFVRRNLVGLATLLVAIGALVVAIQANQISKKNTISEIDIDTGHVTAGWGGMMLACNRDTMGGRHVYALRRQWDYILTVTNHGGQPVSLINADVYDGIDHDSGFEVSVFEGGGLPPQGQSGEELPVDMQPGITRRWTVHIEKEALFDTRQQALAASDWSGYPQTQQPVVWWFQFSDGTILSREVPAAVSYINRVENLEETLDFPCW